MRSRVVKWLLYARMASVLLFAFLLVSVSVMNSPTVNAADPSKAKAEKAEPLDLNMATVEQVKALPGIGEAYSGEDHPAGDLRADQVQDCRETEVSRGE